MLNFKEQLSRDIKNVFHNNNEFAEKRDIYYNGKSYFIPVIVDHAGTKERKKTANDNVEGIMISDAIVYINYEDLNVLPKKGRAIEIDMVQYNILKSSNEEGEIILELEMFDE